MRRFRMLSITVLLLSACSQEDPGDPNTKPEDGGSVAGDYYPMVAGSTLVYRHSGGSSTWDDETKVSAIQHEGKAAFLTVGAPDPKGETSKNIIVQIGSQIHRAHKEELRADTVQGTVDYVPGFLRFDQAWASADDGDAQNVVYKRVEKTPQGNVVAEDDREHTFTVEARKDSVTVPAGKFDDCMRVRRVRVRGNPANASDDDDKVFWFCAGIGKVKELSEVGGSNEELVSCDVPGGLCP
jgi:hypothetical protein